jgi:DeoR family transcriptional regulator, suf operon transcriptional repressor
MERFPTKYLRLTTRLLAQMKETMPGPVVAKLFNQIAEELADQYAAEIKALNMEERLDFVKELLGTGRLYGRMGAEGRTI